MSMITTPKINIGLYTKGCNNLTLISTLIKYNGSFYKIRNINYTLNDIIYNKYGNQWIGVDKNKLYILDNNLNIIKTINLNKSIYKVFPIDKNNICLIYPKKAVVEIWKTEKVKVKNNISKEIVEKYKQYNKTPPLYITKYRKINWRKSSRY